MRLVRFLHRPSPPPRVRKGRRTPEEREQALEVFEPLDTGVPVTAHLCTAGTILAIAAAAAVELSTICASSRTTLHHVNLVSGVGITEYLFTCLLARAPASPSGSWCKSPRRTSYVVSTTSAAARSAADTTPSDALTFVRFVL